MFDFAWSEFALIGIVGLLFIGPKDMPTAIRTVTKLLKKGRKLAGEFQTHVDEMVREADLGEARDQLRQLRTFNVRGQIMKAIDEDGSIKRTLATDPLASAAAPLPPDAPMPVLGGPVMQPLQHSTGRSRHGLDPAAVPSRHPPFSFNGTAADEEAAAADPAPPIVPPGIARRLRVERAKPRPPAFVPPRAGTGGSPASHPGRWLDHRVEAVSLPQPEPEQDRMPQSLYPADAGLS